MVLTALGFVNAVQIRKLRSDARKQRADTVQSLPDFVSIRLCTDRLFSVSCGDFYSACVSNMKYACFVSRGRGPSNSCVTLRVFPSFVFSDLRLNQVCMVCHPGWAFVGVRATQSRRRAPSRRNASDPKIRGQAAATKATAPLKPALHIQLSKSNRALASSAGTLMRPTAGLEKAPTHAKSLFGFRP